MQSIELEQGVRISGRGPNLIIEAQGESLDPAQLRYVSGTFGDRVQLGERQWAIPKGRGSDVRRLIAISRVCQWSHADAGPAPSRWPDENECSDMARSWASTPLCELPNPIQAMWLWRWLQPGERVLAWLEFADERVIDSPVGRGGKASHYYLLSSTRSALVAIGSFGDVEYLPLTGAIEVEGERGRDRVRAEGEQFRTSLTNQGQFKRAAQLAACAAGPRLREWARLLWQADRKVKPETFSTIEAVLSDAAERGDARARLCHWWLRESTMAGKLAVPVGEGPQLAEAVTAWLEHVGSGGGLIEWMQRWQVPRATAEQVVSELRSRDDERARKLALPLHDHLVGLALGNDALADAQRVAGLVRHALEVGRSEDVRARLDHMIEETGGQAMAELDTRPDGELPDLAQAHFDLLLLRVEWARAEQQLESQRNDLESCLRLRHFDAELSEALQAVAPDEVARRCMAVRSAMAVEALGTLDPPTDWPKIAPVSEESLRDRLPHPCSRGGVWTNLQAFLAKVDMPDHAELAKYCLRTREERVQARVTDACVALGLTGVEVFVSHGELSVGVRAHEGDPAFLLLGSEHLEPDSSLYLDDRELSFAVATELAHLRFGHTRVTSNEVWAGAFDKGKDTIELLLSVVPFVGHWKWGDRLASLAGQLGNQRVSSAIDKAKKALGGESSAPRPRSLDRSEGLIAAHRLMQLTADRAGLLLCGDFATAVRALLKMRPRDAAQLPIIARLGLRDALIRQAKGADPAMDELSARVAALASFYVSRDYDELRREICRAA